MGKIRRLKSPFSDYDIVALQAGDEVKINRAVYTAPDMDTNVRARIKGLSRSGDVRLPRGCVHYDDFFEGNRQT
jgi:hypothetical protein